jgi:hypothetical protein
MGWGIVTDPIDQIATSIRSLFNIQYQPSSICTYSILDSPSPLRILATSYGASESHRFMTCAKYGFPQDAHDAQLSAYKNS